MVRHSRLLSVAFLVVMLAAAPALASGKSSFAFRGGHGFHREFHRHHAHLRRHFSFGVPRQHRFGRHFGFRRKPQFFHSPFKQHHFSPHTGRR
jgi:hypothetical protein